MKVKLFHKRLGLTNLNVPIRGEVFVRWGVRFRKSEQLHILSVTMVVSQHL